VLVPVLPVELRQSLVLDDQQVLSVPLFSCLGEVEAASDDLFIVDDHDLVVGNCMLVVDIDRNARVPQEGCPCVAL